MLTTDGIRALKPKSIFDVVPERFFIERDEPGHKEYIRCGNYYEWKYAVAAFLEPRSILEIGVRYGYSLACMIEGSGCAREVEGWDACLYDPDSNQKAQENLEPLLEDVCFQFLKVDACEVHSSIPWDLVHIDGPHHYDGTKHCLELLKDSKAILVDDVYDCPDDMRACKDFVRETRRQHFILPSLRGDCLILRP